MKKRIQNLSFLNVLDTTDMELTQSTNKEFESIGVRRKKRILPKTPVSFTSSIEFRYSANLMVTLTLHHSNLIYCFHYPYDNLD